MKKTEDEILKLKRASLIADECFEYICKEIHPGMTEIEIANLMDNYMCTHGAEGLAFDTIVGSGVNSAQIHSTPTDKKIEINDIILLDFGCVCEGYCSDISRTIFVGSITDEQEKIYKIVREAQERGIKEIVSGTKCSTADLISRNIIRNAGFDFAHTLGHGVGREVHEVPTIYYKNDNDILIDDMLFTIEPGIYLENKFGVRIEDTVIMKDGKIEPLNHVSKDIMIL